MGDGKSKEDNSARGRRRRRGNQNRIDLMTLFGYVLLGIIVFLLGVWCICGLEFEKQEQNPSQQQYQVPRRRPARRAHSTKAAFLHKPFKAAWRVWAPKSSHQGKFERLMQMVRKFSSENEIQTLQQWRYSRQKDQA